MAYNRDDDRLDPTGSGRSAIPNGQNDFFMQFFNLLESLGARSPLATTGGADQPGGGGGGGGGELRRALQQAVLASLAQGPPQIQLDPSFAERFGGLTEEAESLMGVLPQLDPETLAEFETIRSARMADVAREAEEQRNLMLTRLFGSGMQQSTFAAERAGQFGEQVARAQQQVESDIAGQRLQARQGLAETNLQNLQLRFQALAEEQAGALEELGINADLVTQERNRTFGLLSDLETARMAAGAQVRSARIGAAAQERGQTLNFLLGGAGLMQEAALSREEFALRRELGRMEADVANRASRRQARSGLIGGLGSLAVGIAGLAGLFSDKRLKKQLVRVQTVRTSKGDFGWYQFTWLDGRRDKGVVAQEIVEVFPEVVWKDERGYLHVSYALLAERVEKYGGRHATPIEIASGPRK